MVALEILDSLEPRATLTLQPAGEVNRTTISQARIEVAVRNAALPPWRGLPERGLAATVQQ